MKSIKSETFESHFFRFAKWIKDLVLLLHESVVYSFLLPGGVSSHRCAATNLSIHFLKVFLVVDSFWATMGKTVIYIHVRDLSFQFVSVNTQ